MAEEKETGENNEDNKEVKKKQTEEKSEEETEEKSDFSEAKEKMKKNPWLLVSGVLAVIVIILLVMTFRGGIIGSAISENDAAEKLVSYLNKRAGGGVSFVSAEDVGNLYRVNIQYRGDKISLYITKDGKYFVQSAIPLTGQVTQPTQQPQQQDIPKSNKPEVELFIMSFCPFGLQAIKGIIPVLELLGDKIDAEIRFVHYFMHGDKEEQETYRQVCIREEQEDKWLSYLKCFLEDGDSERCLTKTKINKAKLDSCVESKAKDYYASDSELSQGYGVRGSPTLIVNGQTVSSGRSPDIYLQTICSAFNKQPGECSEELSAENPSSGFGYSASGSGGTGQC